MSEGRAIMYLSYLILVFKFNQPYAVLYMLGFFILAHVSRVWLDHMRDKV